MQIVVSCLLALRLVLHMDLIPYRSLARGLTRAGPDVCGAPETMEVQPTASLYVPCVFISCHRQKWKLWLQLLAKAKTTAAAKQIP